MRTYMYRIERGVAVLNKGDDMPLVTIARCKTDTEAKAKCLDHFKKACQRAGNLGHAMPQLLWT